MKKHTLVFLLSAVPFTAAFSQAPHKKAEPKNTAPAAAASPLKTLKDSASYAIGLNIAHNLRAQSMGDISLELLIKGLNDVFGNKKAYFPDSVANASIGNFQQKSEGVKAEGNKIKGQQYLAANAKKKGVISLPNGIQYEILKTGKDTLKPTLNDKVKCHYHGTLIDGTVFDSSVDRGEPITFPLNGVIKGWQEALQLMTVGSKWRIVIPSDLAYGDAPAGPKIGPGSTLVFEVELLGIEK